jgi:hypothetical protein
MIFVSVEAVKDDDIVRCSACPLIMRKPWTAYFIVSGYIYCKSCFQWLAEEIGETNENLQK